MKSKGSLDEIVWTRRVRMDLKGNHLDFFEKGVSSVIRGQFVNWPWSSHDEVVKELFQHLKLY